LTSGRRQDHRRTEASQEEEGQVARDLEGGEHIPLQDLGGAVGGDDEDTFTPLIHPAPEEQADEAKAIKETDKNVPPKKRKKSP
jgi:hypothetical protein